MTETISGDKLKPYLDDGLTLAEAITQARLAGLVEGWKHSCGLPEAGVVQPPASLVPNDDVVEKVVYQEVCAMLEREGYYSPGRVKNNELLARRATGIYYHTQQTRPSAVTCGLPDLLIQPRARDGLPLIIPVELKRRIGGRVTGEQKAAVAFGTYICRSAEQVLWVLMQYGATRDRTAKNERVSPWRK